MKSYLSIKMLFILIIISIFSMGGCSQEKQSKITNSSHGEYQVYDNKLIITLRENPATGYTWRYIMDKNGILELWRDEYKSSDNSGTVGSGGEHIWVFKGISKGDVVITFNYYRPWEDVSKVVETRRFTICVGENGSIKSVK